MLRGGQLGHRREILALLILLALIVVVFAVVVGPVDIPIGETLSYLIGRGGLVKRAQPTHYLIISDIRLPRVLLGLLVGWSLALAGGTMQGLFKNPLASPYVLGVASGASAGAALVALLRPHGALLLPLGAFVGGALAVTIVYRIAQRHRRGTSIYTLILAGVAVGAMFSALTSFMIFLTSRSQRLTDIIFWTMGGLGRGNWPAVYVLAPIAILSSLVILAFSRDLNALSLGEESAFHLGINPERSNRILLGVSTLLTSAAIAGTGTIGFVGLITPHIMRLILGPDHRWLLPASGVAGGIFLVLADMLARTVVQPAELPVGVITAFVGAPFFLWLLRTRGGNL
ncbi:MAG: iron chelate uptake ABC transporter family permease subunit [Candidatus Bipolaricaulota bacterium]|nr:iron chelate uptake ABC transporter family permease subunit [Candidatus Bipolaricaulota bacterium]